MQSYPLSLRLPDVGSTTFGRTYATEPDKLIEQLKADAAVMSADTLFNTIPTGIGMDVNVKILDNFATHLAPALGWQLNHKSPLIGYPID